MVERLLHPTQSRFDLRTFYKLNTYDGKITHSSCFFLRLRLFPPTFCSLTKLQSFTLPHVISLETVLKYPVSSSGYEWTQGIIPSAKYNILLYKVQCFIGISGTDKTDNLTCEVIYQTISHAKFIAFQTIINQSFWIFYIYW